MDVQAAPRRPSGDALATGAVPAFLRANWDLAVPPVLAALVLARQLAWPIDYNESMFVVFGREMLDGALPYRDLFDQKPPLIFAWYALVIAVTGDGYLPARATVFAAVALTSVFVTLIGREFYGRRLALLAGVAFALIAGSPAIGINAGLDQLTLLPLTAGIWCVFRWRRARTLRLLAIGGVAIGCSVMLKQVGVTTAAFLGLVVLVTSRRPADLVAYGLAVAAPGLAIVAVLAAVGILPDAIEATVVFAREYSSAGWEGSKSQLPLWILALWGLSLGPLLVLAVVAVPGVVTAGRGRWWLGGLWLAAVIGLSLPGHFLQYYAWHALPATALLVPSAFEWLRRRRRLHRLLVVLPAAFVFAFTSYLAIALPTALESSGTLLTPEAAESVAATILQSAEPGDRIWVRANVPHLYWYTGLQPAHRYFTPQMFGPRPEAEERTVAELAAAPPRFIAVREDPEYPDEVIPALRRLLDERYERIAEYSTLVAYRRVD